MDGVPGLLRREAMVALCTAAFALAGCGNNTPFAVSRERHPEFYDALVAAEKARADVPEAPPPPPAAPPPAAPDFAELPGETFEAASADPQGPGTRLDLGAALLSGTLRIDVNDPLFAGRLDPLFDGDTSTLSRTEEINPLVLLFHLDPPIRLAAVQIFPSYSTYDWAVRPHPEGPRWILRGAADEEWSRIDLPEPVETGQVRIEVRRLVRDNYVHVNEVELLVVE